MSLRKKTVVSSLLCMVIVIAGGAAWYLPTFLNPKGGTLVHAAPALPYNATANGPYSVKGNTIVGANGQPYIFHGIGRDGLEFNCSGEGPLDSASLAHMGSGNSTNGSYYWGAKKKEGAKKKKKLKKKNNRKK